MPPDGAIFDQTARSDARPILPFPKREYRALDATPWTLNVPRFSFWFLTSTIPRDPDVPTAPSGSMAKFAADGSDRGGASKFCTNWT